MNYSQIAYNIIRISAGVQAGNRVTILGRADSLDFCEALELECRRLSAHPLVIVGSDAALLATLVDSQISDQMLSQASPQLIAALEASEIIITTFFERADPQLFSSMSPNRLRAMKASEEAPSNIIYDGTRRWIGTEVPTPEQALALGCDWTLLHNMFWQAMTIDYNELSNIATKLAAKLQNAETLHLQDDSGRTDLWLQRGQPKRPLELDDGIISPFDQASGALYLNLPSGEVCYAPPEDSAWGTAYIELAFWQGQPIRGLQLEFERGKVKALHADSGLEIFQEVVANAGGDSNFLGEFGIGLNPAVTTVTGLTLLDEKMIGTCHLALGENRILGGVNDSALHWDLVVQKAILSVDDEIVLKNNQLYL